MVVIGPSGSGKSTFLRCLNCMEDPTGGQIILTVLILRILKLISIFTGATWEWYSSISIFLIIRQSSKTLC